MNVQVRYGFAAVTTIVDYNAVAGFSDTEFFRERGGREQQMPEQRLIGDGGFAESGQVFLWDHEHVDRRLRVDVVNGDAKLVLVRELRRNLAIDDFLENGFHKQRILQEETERTENL